MLKRLSCVFCILLVAVATLYIVMSYDSAYTSAGMNTIDKLLSENPHLAIAKIDSIMRADSAVISKHKVMKLRLMRERARNSVCMPLCSKQEAKELVEYFERHGTDKERMSANYVLGSVYRDEYDYPQALDCYHKALSFQKLSPDSSDYAFLHRVHGQIGDVLFQQLALKEAEHEFLEAERLAYLAKDTLSAILLKEQTAGIYYFENDKKKEYEIRNSIYHALLKRGLKRKAVKALVPATETMLSEGKVDEIGRILAEYEKDTLDFDKYGNVFEGGEFYYSFKGRYYLAKDSLSKAKFYFDKGIHLTSGNDYSPRAAMYDGMTILFKRLGISDSVAKYSELARIATDSLYINTATVRGQQLHAAYLAKEKQKEFLAAKNKVQKYKRTLFVAICVVIACIFIVALVAYRNKMGQIEKRQLQLCIEEMTDDRKKREKIISTLQKERDELKMLNNNQKLKIESLLSEKKLQIKEATRKHDKYEKDKKMLGNNVILHFKELANIKRKRAEKEDWEYMDAFVAEYMSSVYLLKPVMSKLEYEITILVCLDFSPSEMSIITDNSSSNISNIRRRLYKKTTGNKGSAKDYDEYVKKLI